VVWGWLHGTALAVERYFRKAGFPHLKPGWTWLQRIAVFHLVCLSWIFFRAESLGSAVSLLRGLGRWTWQPEYFAALKFLAVFAVPLFLLDLYLENSGEEYVLQQSTPVMRVALACGVIVLISLFSANQANAFIYFQF
jgi:hypothetical protein